ncbi:DUF2946 family protein [Undibacterium macrobrachii]|jgi:hypothetical protein|uniref:DUF2946 family protein n=1 Tax=Undibacterium macrobrachii TaxID=1119058 RepID=A0ABQ2XE79_9BURK|nr:DUF2946 family protein [Undibacterium macrobrachii]GGX12784.1 hypothetical protein GCM10011282_18560 [Undibacterium macrobrachii]
MDDIVLAAMAKWPNVPHCYGWLTLDARGNWRMRDERAQALNLLGDVIRNPTLQNFINRNYLCDENGNWYFQNGPQKVYVDLAATPYIAQILPDQTWRLHTGQIMPPATRVWMLDDGNIVCQADQFLCQLDDRDIGLLLETLTENQQTLAEERLLEFMEASTESRSQFKITARVAQQKIALQKTDLTSLLNEVGYCQKPR